jgi:hypothetical protein
MAVASSASILLLPQSTQRVIYTPLLEESHRDTVSRVYFNSGTPFASEKCVCHIRDCDTSHPFRLCSYTSWPGGVEPPGVDYSRWEVFFMLPLTLGR